jgi:hypothetical protein
LFLAESRFTSGNAHVTPALRARSVGVAQMLPDCRRQGSAQWAQRCAKRCVQGGCSGRIQSFAPLATTHPAASATGVFPESLHRLSMIIRPSRAQEPERGRVGIGRGAWPCPVLAISAWPHRTAHLSAPAKRGAGGAGCDPDLFSRAAVSRYAPQHGPPGLRSPLSRAPEIRLCGCAHPAHTLRTPRTHTPPAAISEPLSPCAPSQLFCAHPCTQCAQTVRTPRTQRPPCVPRCGPQLRPLGTGRAVDGLDVTRPILRPWRVCGRLRTSLRGKFSLCSDF